MQWHPRITKTQADILKEFLEKELPEHPTKPGLTNVIEHKIEVTCEAPIKQRHYLVSPKVMEAITTEVDEMLRDEVIEPSNSGWSSSVVMGKKPDSTYRLTLTSKVTEV